jgi:hypothetical protein
MSYPRGLVRLFLCARAHVSVSGRVDSAMDHGPWVLAWHSCNDRLSFMATVRARPPLLHRFPLCAGFLLTSAVRFGIGCTTAANVWKQKRLHQSPHRPYHRSRHRHRYRHRHQPRHRLPTRWSLPSSRKKRERWFPRHRPRFTGVNVVRPRRQRPSLLARSLLLRQCKTNPCFRLARKNSCSYLASCFLRNNIGMETDRDRLYR